MKYRIIGLISNIIGIVFIYLWFDWKLFLVFLFYIGGNNLQLFDTIVKRIIKIKSNEQ